MHVRRLSGKELGRWKRSNPCQISPRDVSDALGILGNGEFPGPVISFCSLLYPVDPSTAAIAWCIALDRKARSPHFA